MMVAKISVAQRRALESARDYGGPARHIKGRSAAGGFCSTQAVLLREIWIDTDGNITPSGLRALEQGT
jgi:hypothetical protein